MKIHFVYIIYILTITCGGGWYIHEQKEILAEQDRTIQELTASQRPAIVPDKRKIKYVEKIVEKTVPVPDKQCIEDYKVLYQKTVQCAYNLKFCQESSDIYEKMKPDGNKN